MLGKIWMNDEIVNWVVCSNGGSYVNENLWRRSYEIWEYAKSLIEDANNDYQLGDGIANLKRSLDRRLKLIEELYCFRSIDPKYKNKGYLEILEQYGIVRPFVMKILMDIRNDIEHNDAIPPNISRCKELVDVVWYFLKSTDPIVTIKRDSFGFALYDCEGSETQYGYTADVNFENGAEITISGWFPGDFVHQERRKMTSLIELEIINGKERWKDSLDHKDKLDSDLWIIGKANFELPVKNIFLKHIFNLVN